MSKENLANVVLTILSKSKAELIYYPSTSKDRKTPEKFWKYFLNSDIQKMYNTIQVITNN